METLTLNNSQLIKALPEIAKAHLGKPVTELKFVGGGSFGKVFQGKTENGKTVMLKAYRTQGMQEKEARNLQMLSANTRVKMPQVYFTHADESTAVMGMSLIEGQNVLNPLFLLKSVAQKEKFAKDVVDGLLDLHSVTNEKYGDLDNPTYSSWLEYYRDEMVVPKIEGLKKLNEQNKFSNNSFNLLSRATELFFKVADEPEKPVLIHADLNIMNIMADPKTFELTGFIDPGNCVWADREYDLFQFLNMWGGCYKLLDTYKAKCKLSEHSELKIAYYAALNEASCRLSGGLIMPLWEIQCNQRLKKAIKKYI